MANISLGMESTNTTPTISTRLPNTNLEPVVQELLGLGGSELQTESAYCPAAGRWRVYCPDTRTPVGQPRKQAGQCSPPHQLRKETERRWWLLTILHSVYCKVSHSIGCSHVVSEHLQGSLACISGLSRTLWGMMLPGFGLGWVGMPAVQEAVGGRTVNTGFGALDLTAVWAVRCTGWRGGAAVATEHTTEEKRK